MVTVKFHPAYSDAEEDENADQERVFQRKTQEAYEEFPHGGEEAAGGHRFS